MSYVPLARSQFQPHTATSPDDCVPAACAEAVDRVTVGAIRVTHVDIRRASAKPFGGRLSYSEGVNATMAVTGVQGDVRLGVSPADVKKLLIGGSALTISMDASVTHGTACGTYDFLGDHSEFINSYDPVNDTFHLDDPGTTPIGFHDCPAALILRAALERSGQRGVNVIVWPDTEGVSWTARKVHSLRDLPSYKTGKAIGATRIGTVYAGGRTQNGDPYPLNGRTVDGFVHVLDPHTKRWLWTVGDSFR